MLQNKITVGDCLEILRGLPPNSVDMIYLDPPFFTNKRHTLSSKDGGRIFSFDDVWGSQEEYSKFLLDRLHECKRVLKETGSLFFHGDHNNVHIAKHLLDGAFGSNNFRSEIVWYYKRWSNAKRGLLQQHQNILFYSKTDNFKWNQILTEYSATTNIDQIMQVRARNSLGKATYAQDEAGEIIYSKEKRGVPLGDVWEIPFLNPKARERTGYPTQKPLLLLERIIEVSTDIGDVVLDPFCGSGTTLVACSLLNRKYVGIDISPDAVSLASERIANPIRTESNLLKKGVESYVANDPWVDRHLSGLDYTRVQRNSGIDALLRNQIDGRACFIRVQRENETVSDAISALRRSATNKGDAALLVVKTSADAPLIAIHDVYVVKSVASQIIEIDRSLDGASRHKDYKVSSFV